jgi:hypothetical protein
MPDNGKAERFIQTTLSEWAYATAFNTSEERRAELPRWLHRYNWHRPHASLGNKPPISRLPIIGITSGRFTARYHGSGQQRLWHRGARGSSHSEHRRQ